MDFPVPLKVKGSAASEQQTQPDDVLPLVTGVDYALDNNFFYDEEFAVPFDANLVEDCHSLPTKVGSVLKRILPGGAGDGDLEWQCTEMAPSKSDSCHYQSDQRQTGSQREMSASDDDGSSSSSTDSPLQNQSLFSSCGEPEHGSASVCHSEISDSVMSGSLSKDVDKYDYNWSEGKRRYVLVFDRSREEEFHRQVADGQTRADVTNWFRTKPTRPRLENKEENLDLLSPIGKTNSGLTTWGQVKNQQQGSCVLQRNGLTTWQQVKGSRPGSFRNALAAARVAAQKEESETETAGVEEMASTPGASVGTAAEADISQDEEAGLSRRLFDRYCRFKSQEETGELENNEGMTALLSAEKQINNLPGFSDVEYPGKTTDAVRNIGHGISGLCENIIWRSEMGDVEMRKSTGRIPPNTAAPAVVFGINVLTRSSDHGRDAGQTESPVLTASSLKCHNTVDCSIQFPPPSMDRWTQTSFQFSSSNQSSLTEKSRAQQTSMTASVALSPNDETVNCVRADNEMVRSALLLSRPLPDLSFLKKSANHRAGKADRVRSVEREANDASGNAAQLPQTSSGQENTHQRSSADAESTYCLNYSGNLSPNAVVCNDRPRNSDSTSSVCSSSSSGIDPGFCDSSGSGIRTPHRQSLIFDEANRPASVQTSSKIPPKPLKILTPASETPVHPLPQIETKSRKDSDSTDASGVCRECHSQILSGKVSSRNPVTLLHPATQGHSLLSRQLEYFHVPLTQSESCAGSPSAVMKRLSHDPLTHRRGLSRLTHGKDHVVFRGNQQQQTVKPAKSILVRHHQRRSLAKRRSWSNPSYAVDRLGPKQGECPCCLVNEGRPASLPDENLLHQTSGVLQEQGEGQSVGKIEEDDSEIQIQAAEDVTDKENKFEEEEEVEEEEEEDCDFEEFTAKKSVSFSEKIFYHPTSVTASPLDSPKCSRVEADAPLRTTSTSLTIPKRSVQCKSLGIAGAGDSKTESDECELPPIDFVVSPSASPSSSLSSSDALLSTDILHKRELAFGVVKAAEVLLKHFSQTPDAAKKVHLGSTVENPDVGRLVLQHLCPAILAVVCDGLKLHVNCLFGRMKNSAYKVAEDSAVLGQPVDLIQDLVRSLKSLRFLNTASLLFNAFVFGLLNYKALDFWLMYIHNHQLLLAKHYALSSLIHLHNAAGRQLFLDMVTSLRPLAQLHFRLEYSFEVRLIERQQQEQIAEYLLDRRISCSAEASAVEAQRFLSLSQHVAPSDTVTESKLKRRTKELWQKTQTQLCEKLSWSKELVMRESAPVAWNVAGASIVRQHQPMSFPLQGGDALNYGNFSHNVSSFWIPSHGESEKLILRRNEGHLVETSGSESNHGFFGRVAKQLEEINLKEKVSRRGTVDKGFEESFSSSASLQKINSRNEDLMTMARAQSGRSLAPELKTSIAPCTANNSFIQLTSAFPPIEVKSDCERVTTSASNAMPTTKSDVRMSTKTQSANSSTKVVSSLCTSVDSSVVSNMKPPSRQPMSLPPTVDLDSLLHGGASGKRWSDVGSRLVAIFDRLLLSDSKVTSSTPGSVTSSSVSMDQRLEHCPME